MNTQKCLQIKDLEERLACLAEKYQELTEQISRERDLVTSDENESLYFLQTEREFISKQIAITKRRIQLQQRMGQNKDKALEKVEVGCCIKLKNHSHDLEVCIVSACDARPTDGLVSNLSPIGKAAMGRSLGEEILVESPRGQVPYRIEEIRYM
ncbi:GreA/GreB family elongation factor [Candidatus Dojkabacteria bacterium]|nr:GreA/GreB family elongation factor [Candidatus Dojkabacteria bacterium]